MTCKLLEERYTVASKVRKDPISCNSLSLSLPPSLPPSLSLALSLSLAIYCTVPDFALAVTLLPPFLLDLMWPSHVQPPQVPGSRKTAKP